MTRRFFIGGAAAFGSQLAFGARALPSGSPKLKFGVITDVHLAFNGKELMKAWNTETLRQTLVWFRDQGVDAVLCGGDAHGHRIYKGLPNIYPDPEELKRHVFADRRELFWKELFHKALTAMIGTAS